jgi:bifunctional DNA-binding transcriptional regulator/antitoxin component of YhaV-PrlF toxin-antitoxin module
VISEGLRSKPNRNVQKWLQNAFHWYSHTLFFTFLLIVKRKVQCAKISAKRQITLPIDQCRETNIEPGDEYESYVSSDGQITIVKKIKGAAQGVLSHVHADHSVSDVDSLQSVLQD